MKPLEIVKKKSVDEAIDTMVQKIVNDPTIPWDNHIIGELRQVILPIITKKYGVAMEGGETSVQSA